MTQYAFLSGLPRSGSTLLTSILYQNPSIHTEGNSALCQLMWDTQQSCEITAQQQILATSRFELQHDLISAIPDIYYSHTDRPVVIDKCRSWSLPANMDMIRRYITDTPRVIVLSRPIDQILQSFKHLYESNGRPYDESELLRIGSEPIMRSLDGLEYAEKNNSGEYLFIEYDTLIDDTATALDEIYDFLELPRYVHDLSHIVNMTPENDAVYGLSGMHDVRPQIARRDALL